MGIEKKIKRTVLLPRNIVGEIDRLDITVIHLSYCCFNRICRDDPNRKSYDSRSQGYGNIIVLFPIQKKRPEISGLFFEFTLINTMRNISYIEPRLAMKYDVRQCETTLNVVLHRFTF
jgi:hypothetical protein